jgi:hypothetical protein
MDNDSCPKDRTPLPSGVASTHTHTSLAGPITGYENPDSRSYGASERIMDVTQTSSKIFNVTDSEECEASKEVHDAQEIGLPIHTDSDSKKRKHSNIQPTTISRPVLGLFPRYSSGNYVDQRLQQPAMTVTRKTYGPPSINVHQPHHFPQNFQRETVNGIRSLSAKQPPLKPVYHSILPPIDDGYIEGKCDELFLKIECYARALRGIEIDLSELKTMDRIIERLSETAEVPTRANPVRHIFYIEPEKRRLFTTKPALTETLRELFNVRPDRTVCQELDTLNPGLNDLSYESLICSCHAFLLGRLARQEYDGSVDSGGALRHTLETGFFSRP